MTQWHAQWERTDGRATDAQPPVPRLLGPRRWPHLPRVATRSANLAAAVRVSSSMRGLALLHDSARARMPHRWSYEVAGRHDQVHSQRKSRVIEAWWRGEPARISKSRSGDGRWWCHLYLYYVPPESCKV